jgi:RNA polymerase sigma factor (sigma-70 family)
MSTPTLQALLDALRQAAGTAGHCALGDEQLLERWLARRDEAAFEVLLWRHGPMVLGVCRRLLSRPGDAEDAFQATFLTLLRRAASIRHGNALAAWLHRVAHRIALRLRAASARLARRERTWDDHAEPVLAAAATDSDLGEQLDREIDRLPDSYRRIVVLCLLEGHTQAEAARRLGLPLGTVSSRLSRARARLQGRLARQGLAPRPAVLPAALVENGMHLALAGSVPASIADLSSGVINEMIRHTICKTLLLTCAAVLLFAGGSVPIVRHLFSAARGADEPAEKASPEPPVTFSFLAREPFAGRLRLNWKVVRPDDKYVSLTRNKGKLTITTQRGTIHADETARKEPKAKNLYLIDNPLADDTSFVVTTRISGFTPKQRYQQAALICYDDDDNYVKFAYEFNWKKDAGQTFDLVRETKAVSQQDHVEAPAGIKTLWLRLTRRKDLYEYATSTNGRDFEVHGERSWQDRAPAKIGILAKNGGIAGVPEVDVCFELFELRAPAPAAAKKE